ncbi:MAG: macro domain-containing protein [Acidobacteria bacterium]|nr:macro domain-containing protein [Acidobacteriota bacterium]
MTGDITTLEVDAIVNAANTSLQHGGGVAGAISRAGGPVIQRESDAIGRVPTGSAEATSAGNLAAKWVIHAVGPVWGDGDEEAKLRSAVRSALDVAVRLGARTVAFPAISTGIYGYPKEKAAPVMLDEAKKVGERSGEIDEIIFCLFDRETLAIFEQAMKEHS